MVSVVISAVFYARLGGEYPTSLVKPITPIYDSFVFFVMTVHA